MDPLFDALPDDLTTLTDDQINERLEELRALETRLHDGDLDVGEATNQQVIDEYTRLVEAIETLQAEQATRLEASEATQREMEELHRRAQGEEHDPNQPNGDEEEEEESTEEESEEAGEEPVEEPAQAEQEPEPVAASAAPDYRRRPYRIAAPSPSREITVREDERLPVITAAAGVPGRVVGDRLDLMGLYDALRDRHRAFAAASVPEGFRDQVVVASIHSDIPDERVLDSQDAYGNWDRIQAAIGGFPGSPAQHRNLVATGGICSPSEINYAIDVLGGADRPVRDSLPAFGARRGGIRFVAPPTVGDVNASAISDVTAAEDLAGGSGAVKTCWHVTCPTFSEVQLGILAQCLTFGNLQARTYPELVAAWTELVNIVFAQTAEVKLIDAISSASTAVTTTAGPTGIYGTIMEQLIRAATAYRSRFRLPRTFTLQALAPQWMADAIVADTERTQFYRGSLGQEQVAGEIRRLANVAITFYLDSRTGGGQVFGSQAAGLLSGWPANVEWYLFTPGTFIYLDGGTLDLGLVRDSTLNSTNDYQIFSEEFFNIAKVGQQSLRVTTAVCVSGETAGTVDVICGS